MIHYQLRCDSAHDFEGWFRDSGAFEEQAAGGLLHCPFCGSQTVDRGLMAPAVRTARAVVPSDDRPGNGPVVAAPASAATPMPDALKAGLQKLRKLVEHHCEDLGDRFAEEAFRMQSGDAPERAIYGNASRDDREALADAGIDVIAVPWLPAADS